MKLLTILIPSYNRIQFLKGLVSQLTEKIQVLNLEKHIEVKVFNNCSTDGTDEVLGELRSIGHKFDLVSYSDHVASAEENVFRSFKLCSGEYVWVLGDDDVPVYDNLEKVISLLQTNKFDFLQFNNAVFNENSIMTNHSLVEFSNEVFEAPIVHFASYMGLWFTLAGMSGQILRRNKIEKYDLSELVAKKMVIYSHVVAYLEVFKSHPFAFVNVPLVNYRVTYVDSQHWRKTANRIGFKWEHFWGIGTIEQLNYLYSKNVLPADFAFSCFDVNDFFRFRFVFSVISKILSQVKFGIKYPSQRLSKYEIELFESFILRQSPMFASICHAIKDLHYLGSINRFNLKAIFKSRRLVVRADKILRNLEGDPFFGLFVQKSNGVSTYRVGQYFLNSWEYPSELSLRYLPDGHILSEIYQTREQASDAANSAETRGLPPNKIEHFSKLEFAQLKKIAKLYLAFKDLLKSLVPFRS